MEPTPNTGNVAKNLKLNEMLVSIAEENILLNSATKSMSREGLFLSKQQKEIQ